MAGSEAHGLWYCVLLIFEVFAILRSREWPVPDYQNSLFLLMKQEKLFPGASPHEEHDVNTSASDKRVQHKIWMLPQPTNKLIIE